MNKIKLSFNKNSKGDLLAVAFFAAGVLILAANGLGYTISNEQISSWVGLIFQILGGLGLVRNTSTGTSQPQKSNVSSEDVSKAIDLAQKLASVAVPEHAVNPGLTKAERKKAGIHQVLSGLADIGLSLDSKTVAGIVEQTYQLYRASGGTSLDVTQTPAPTEVIEPDKGADENE